MLSGMFFIPLGLGLRLSPDQSHADADAETMVTMGYALGSSIRCVNLLLSDFFKRNLITKEPQPM
jgi:hypothetical protein